MKRNQELQTENEAAAGRLFAMIHSKEDVRGDIQVMRRTAEKADSELTAAELEKQRQASLSFLSFFRCYCQEFSIIFTYTVAMSHFGPVNLMDYFLCFRSLLRFFQFFVIVNVISLVDEVSM